MMRTERNGERDGDHGNMCREDSHCHRFYKGPNPMVARYFYAILFLLASLSAWAVRENHITFFEGQRLNGCLGNRDCLAAEVVLIISLTSFVSFKTFIQETFYLHFFVLALTKCPSALFLNYVLLYNVHKKG